MSSDLPEGWAVRPILDVIDYEGGAQPPKSTFKYAPEPGYVRLLQIRDFGDSPFPTYVPDSQRLKRVKEDDLLIARYGGGSASDTLGRICTGMSGAYNVALAKLVFPRHEVLPGFLRAFFLGPWFKEHVSRNSRSCQTGFNRDDLRELELQVPPLAEQRRIVAKVEALLAEVNAARERLAKVPAILKRFRQSVLAAACSGRLTEEWRMKELAHGLAPPDHADSGVSDESELPELPEGWRRERLGAVASFINGDRSKRYPNKDEYVDAGLPFINTGHIDPDGSLSIARMNYLTRERWASLSGGKIQEGDLVYCLRGATLGKTALVEPFTEGAIASSLVIIRPKKSLVPKYSYFFLVSPLGRAEIGNYDNGSAQPNLSAQNVARYLVPLPTIGEQHEIVRRTETLFKAADAIEKHVAAATVRADKVAQAVLAKAFRGELVPTEAELAREEGREYEPASALLERVQHELSEAPTRRRKAGVSEAAGKVARRTARAREGP